MKREITTHRDGAGLNELLKIQALDRPGPGGASRAYAVDADGRRELYVNFQDGDPAAVGVNGVSNEALLAIVEDRLAGFQSGPFPCEENACALKSVRFALGWLRSRSLDRQARRVEGKQAA